MHQYINRTDKYTSNKIRRYEIAIKSRHKINGLLWVMRHFRGEHTFFILGGVRVYVSHPHLSDHRWCYSDDLFSKLWSVQKSSHPPPHVGTSQRCAIRWQKEGVLFWVDFEHWPRIKERQWYKYIRHLNTAWIKEASVTLRRTNIPRDIDAYWRRTA